MNQTTKLLKIFERIKESKKIAVFAHMNYDLDALGSLYALSHFLKRQGKSVDMFTDSQISKIDAKLFNPELLSDEPKKYDCLISVDCANANRLGKYSEYFKAETNTIRFDHHKGLNYDTSLELTYPNYSSCSELIMEVIESLGKKPDRLEATYLYAGLISDTNSFMNTNVTIKSLQRAVKLLEYGADYLTVSDIVSTTTLEAKKLEAIMFEKLEKIDETTSLSILTLKDYKSVGADPSDFSNFAKLLLNVEGTNIACLIKQRDEHTFTASFRSRLGYDVLSIANAIGGGGHPQAAGALLIGKESEIKAKVVKALKEHK